LGLGEKIIGKREGNGERKGKGKRKAKKESEKGK